MLYAAGDREKEKKKFYLDSDSFCQYLYFTSSKIFASEVACLSPLQRWPPPSPVPASLPICVLAGTEKEH